MGFLRSAILAIGLLGFTVGATACGGAKKDDTAATANPCASGEGDPCAKDPCANPCGGEGNPCANPCGGEANPCGANPCGAANPCGGNPCGGGN